MVRDTSRNASDDPASMKTESLVPTAGRSSYGVFSLVFAASIALALGLVVRRARDEDSLGLPALGCASRDPHCNFHRMAAPENAGGLMAQATLCDAGAANGAPGRHGRRGRSQGRSWWESERAHLLT
ncbi:hypothetical protein BN2476_680031 [Paraburkholderia piptadeniae]|uniref:Uncharacterized protein n=1 Tax=Paraburkholderia piptadeniae TaxID=1701573 RepID=A0A1N7SQN6_9BURK|nr:hypothetical protein BN2476_680031 [Paraburkholderia piptadeniae]